MRKKDLKKEPKIKKIDNLEIDEFEKNDLPENYSPENYLPENYEEDEPVKSIPALFSFIVYFVSYMIGLVVFFITKHRIAIPFIGMLPALFFLPYTIFGKRKRQWGLFFGICEGINIIVLYDLLKVIIQYSKDRG